MLRGKVLYSLVSCSPPCGDACLLTSHIHGHAPCSLKIFFPPFPLTFSPFLLLSLPLNISFLVVLLSLQRVGTQITMSQLQDTVGVGDMVLLDPMTEDSLVANLKARFAANQIYVGRR